MPECAFCPSTAKLSGEHVWSQWMNALFPGEKKFLNILERKDWSADVLNWTARAVCEQYNNGWMSDIESQHAPAMKDLIAGTVDIPISQSRANSIALFAFKTTVVIEHLNRRRTGRF